QPPIYGRLVKTSGNNCSGFACDIICATDGNIWDVFGDGPDATINYAGVANPQWVSKGTVTPSARQVVPCCSLTVHAPRASISWSGQWRAADPTVRVLSHVH